MKSKQTEIDRATKWQSEHKERHSKNSLTCYMRVRNEIFDILGRKCANPYGIDHSGFDQSNLYIYCLQIDHVQGTGGKKRKSMAAYTHMNFILKQLKTGSKDFQCLCSNCNQIKKSYEGGYNQNSI